MPDVAIIDKLIRDLYIDTRVIVRTNDHVPLMIGILKDFGEKGLPIVEDEHHKLWTVAGIVLPYSTKVYDWLNTINTKEQWQILSKMTVAVKDFATMQHLWQGEEEIEEMAAI